MLAGEVFKRLGDVDKVTKVILDLVFGEGVATGRSLLFRTPLGEDSTSLSWKGAKKQ